MLHAVLVDHYDSFTWNLAHLWARMNGAMPRVVAHDRANWQDVTASNIDAIILSPGPGTVTKLEDFSPLSRRIIAEATVPIFGVCLGHQGIAHMMGGRIVTAPEPRHGRASLVYHHGQDILANLPSPFSVIRYHSLLVAAELLPPLEAIATTRDGLVMAMRHRTRPIWSVQFHPESILTEHGAEIIANFIDLARKARQAKESRPQKPSQSRKSVQFGTIQAVAPHPQATHQGLWREVAMTCQAEAIFRRFFADQPYAVWLDRENFLSPQSSDMSPEFAAVSILGCAGPDEAASVHWNASDNHLTEIDLRSDPPVLTRHPESIFTYLRTKLAASIAINWADGAPNLPFLGGYIGWFGYEVFAEKGGSGSAQGLKPRRSDTPDAMWIKLNRFIAIDHRKGKIYVVALHKAGDADAQRDSQIWCDEMVRKIAEMSKSKGISAADALNPQTVSNHKPSGRSTQNDLSEQIGDPVWQAAKSRQDYCQDIERALTWIRQGECYQICLTNEFLCDTAQFDPELDPLDVFLTMRRLNPAPQAAFISWPDDCMSNTWHQSAQNFRKNAVVSASPERFLAANAQGLLEARPIKGTIRRSPDHATDQALAEQLQNSEKDRAENLMIVDLLRNDLSRVAVPGSVTVPALFAIESFATVHQLVSTIHGNLDQGQDFLAAVQAAFPGGSMTGAPKRRAMEKIDELEQRPRGIYSGALGWLSYDGAGDLAIVIRSLVFTTGKVTLGVGGGIVAQSIPELEYEEMLLKAQAPMKAFAETIRARAKSHPQSEPRRQFQDQVE